MPLTSDLVLIGVDDVSAEFLGHTVGADLTATGNSSQANAYQIETTISGFSVVTALNNSAKLPPARSATQGVYLVKNNDGADTLNLFPALGDNLNVLAANAAIVISPGASRIFFKVSETRWFST